MCLQAHAIAVGGNRRPHAIKAKINRNGFHFQSGIALGRLGRPAARQELALALFTCAADHDDAAGDLVLDRRRLVCCSIMWLPAL
jgi:hypothetical protein